MLDTDTKRRIDTARDILVGKVPDPKSQVEQITIALIYKFMDDMDAESEEFGGKRKFFAGEFARYGWAKLMHSGLGGHEILNLYAEAIAKMPENPGIPLLFRNIFKNAYLPYRDPETLKMFLKVIDEFTYDHSERLGDAFEYLLSVLGSQGDAGQFRTPRHIIDFMVEIIDPKKTETVLDPACGTAGFEISSYKHILKANTDANGNSTMTPEEKGRLAQNFSGYDISPDMVRLSLVNMYLHGFADPHIFEYDTLTSLERWNEHADIILANPPFMSPKGGIKPHNRFSIQAKRSEVLFVDYMAEHLTPSGRAGIIVPEGIIFQSGTAYKQLRKMLMEEYLVAVVSLPAGVFNPYSGVKTSILILDKSLAKKTDSILFLRIQNEGTDLGARRKSVIDSELPEAVSIYRRWTDCFRGNGHHQLQEGLQGCESIVVSKVRIATDGEYNLTAERYRDNGLEQRGTFTLVRIGELIVESTVRVKDKTFPVWSVSNQLGFVNTEEYFDKQVASLDISNYKVVAPGFFAYNPSRINVGSVALNSRNEYGAVSPMYVVFSASSESVDKDFFFALIKSEMLDREINRVAQGAIRTQLRFKDLANLRIPLPTLEVQKEIVAKIEGYKKIIEGARSILDNYHPNIDIHPEWSLMKLGEISEVTSSKRILAEEYVPSGTPFYRTKEIVELSKGHDISLELFISKDRFESIKAHFGVPDKGDLLVSAVGTIGISWVVSDDREFYFKDGNLLWIKNLSNIDSYFLKYCLDSTFAGGMDHIVFGAAYKALTIEKLKEFKIPIPPLETQQAIIAEIEAEQKLVDANRELIARFEKKIQATLARIWGDDKLNK